MPAAGASPGQEDWPDWDDWSASGAPAETPDQDDAEEDEAADDDKAGPRSDGHCRMDKWLWAARFYRTRSLAKEAIEGGKVHCDGQRVKVSKEVKVGMTLDIRQGLNGKSVVVKALSEVRGSAAVAQQLYEETAASLAARDQHQADRRAQNLAHPDHRPNKKERRQIHRFKDHRGD